MKAVLISTYELGRQPFGLASPAAWLRDAGVEGPRSGPGMREMLALATALQAWNGKICEPRFER